MLSIINANIIAPRGVKRGNIFIKQGKIIDVTFGRKKYFADKTIDAKGNFASPGFIDLHIHGDAETISKTQLRSGTTGFLKAIYAASKYKTEQYKTGTLCLGINMEGPFINKKMRGALPAKFIKKPVLKYATEIITQARGTLKIMTIAPEVPGNYEIINLLRKHGIMPSIGHTDSDFTQAKKAVEQGARYATHVFNRMRGLSQREPGALGAVLEDDRVVAEIVLDGKHVHPACFRILLKTKGSDRIVLATDSVACGPIPGSRRKGIFFILKDGTYAGSALTMNQAVKNAVKFGGISIHEAVKMATLNPAKVLGISNKKGTIEKGKDADIIIFDGALDIKTAIVNGHIVYNKLG